MNDVDTMGNLSSVASRFEQLSHISTMDIDGIPLLIHGSIAHAAMMGIELPPEIKPNGKKRDIDLMAVGIGKKVIEGLMGGVGLDSPSPVDAGLSDLLAWEGSDMCICKDGVAVPVRETSPFEDITNYEILGSQGLEVQSFGPVGMLAAHSLEPASLPRINHPLSDRRLMRWFADHEVQLPKGLKASIAEFHRVYEATYPHGRFYNDLSRIYVRVIPEVIRSKLRHYTHRFMLEHAGRPSPFVGE